MGATSTTRRDAEEASFEAGKQTSVDNILSTFDSDVTITDAGDGYGWKYDFENALENGVILPPSPDTPGVFELKNPNQNIKGVVR